LADASRRAEEIRGYYTTIGQLNEDEYSDELSGTKAEQA